MKFAFRGLTLLTLSASTLLLAACGTTQSPTANMSNAAEANRVNSILERAAREAKAGGNKAETVTLLEQIYLRNEDDAAVATSYGQALREDDQLNKARQVLAPFAEGEKAFPDAVVELAMVQLGLGQYKLAELTSRRAVELDPNQGRAYLALGTALDAQNYHEQAEVAFRRGLQKWNGDPAPLLNNLALNLASQNKLDQALDLLRRAQAESPGRQEIERNIRIISTLKEGADDFLVKEKQGAQKATEAAKAEKKPEAKPAEKAAPKVDPKVETKVEAKKPAEKAADKAVEKPAAKVADKPAEETKTKAE